MEFNFENAPRFLCMLCLILYLNIGTSNALNNRPVIGVLAQATSGKMAKYGDSYIAASYVKFLESAGARVVPILLKKSDSYYEKLFGSLNGVLFPGGGVSDLINSQYGKVGSMFYDLAIKSYDKHGISFPIWGTCLGLELLTILTAKQSLLADVDSIDVSLPLKFTKDYLDSRLFHGADKSILDILSTQHVTYNYHRYGLTPTNFSKSSALNTFYRVMSTNTDSHGVSFISSMEAINYPIYAIQYHPEKNPYEWKSTNIHHTASAIAVSSFFADFIVEEARKNYNSFSEGTIESYLIYNYSPVYTGDVSSFEQRYFFPM